MRVLVIATVFAAVGSCLSIIGGSSANADGLAPTRVCKVVVVGGTFGTQSGVASSGECPGDNSNVPLVVAVGCMSDGTAVVDHVVQSLSRRCKSNVPDCQLLVDGGQSGPNLIKAMEYQRWDPGAHRWINLQFFCPQSSAPVPAGPDLAAIRDRVIRLLPRVAAATTGPNTLVNIQTVLWADTPERRSLGRVLVVGQPVWLRLAFDHAAWDFGDGTTLSSHSPGKAYDAGNDPCRTVSCPDYFGHTYTATGVMSVRVRIAWRATYSLDGQHYQPVDSIPLTGPADTVRIHVRQARGVLVATGD